MALGSTITEATILSAALNWVLKDGLGQFGVILLSAKVGKNFDADVKRWRFRAPLFLNLAVGLEFLTLAFPSYFLILASVANMSKGVCMLLASATKANANMRFALQNNIGDIASKSVSQYTITSLAGFGIGMGISACLPINTLSVIIPLFSSLSAVNLYSAYKIATSVSEPFLNADRMQILVDIWVKEK